MVAGIRSAILMGMLGTSLASLAAGEEKPPLLVPRQGGYASLRPDGRVLLMGGSSPSVELYDYRGGGNRILAPFPQHFWGSVALRDGRILSCGVTCYMYDPARDEWRQTSAPGGSLILLSLRVLPDGRVLTAGDGGPLHPRESYVYNPSTEVWTRVGDLQIGRSETALQPLADGRVLAVAGVSARVSIPGVPFPQVDLDQVERFDPSTNQWEMVAPLSRIAGPVATRLLPDGRVLAVSTTVTAAWQLASVHGAEIYDPAADRWTPVTGLTPPSGMLPSGASITVLPNGQVLIAGGQASFDPNSEVFSSTTLFDPLTLRSRPGPSLRTKRAGHLDVVTQDGTVLLMGGTSGGSQALASVESVPWEPALKRALDPGFYIATAAQNLGGDDGFWGIEVQSSGPLDGGLNFGGLLAGGGKEVGFGAFHIAEPQTVSTRVNLQALPGTTGPLEVVLNVLDVNKKLVAGPIQGIGNLTWSQALQPGFYVLELRSSDRAPAASFQMAVTAPQLQAGGSAGASLAASAGVTGFVGFYLASKQDVTINLYNEQTYGYPRGAGEVILTMYDAAGKVLQRVGPGATPP